MELYLSFQTIGADEIKHEMQWRISSGDTKALTILYLKELTQYQKQLLVDTYYYDFLAFGYSFSEYI